MIRQISCILMSSFLIGLGNKYQDDIPLIFPEYGVEIFSIPKLGDTIYYRVSSTEDFKFVFFDKKGKCFCERYVNKKLYQRGYYENSLDTLKRYVSSRAGDGQHSAIRVQPFFQPLKNGEWITYINAKPTKKNYLNGVIQ